MCAYVPNSLHLLQILTTVLSAEQALELDSIFRRFCTDTTFDASGYSHAFLVGVSNHWVTVVVNKPAVSVARCNSLPEVLLLDSRNEAVLSASEDRMREIIVAYYDRLERQRETIDHREFRERMFLLSLKDTQFAVDLICQCVSGGQRFATFYVDLLTETLLDDFESNVLAAMQPPQTLTLELINQWLREIMPTSAVIGFVRKVCTIGLTMISQEKRQRLRRWNCEMLPLMTADSTVKDEDRLHLFGAAMESLNDAFNAM
jgi:hypothetical protein